MTTLDDYFEYQLEAERKYGPNTIVLYENGHFYEVYGVENNKEYIGKASKMEEILNIKKTRKNTKILENSRSNPLLVGFPSLSLQKYLNVLMNHGFTVVMVEQVTTPPNPRRDLTRVFSPGVYLPEQPRPEYQMIVMIWSDNWNERTKSPWSVSIAALDISTGKTFHYSCHSGGTDTRYVMEDVYRVLEGLNPVELLIWLDPEGTPYGSDYLEEQWELNRRKFYWVREEQVSLFRRLSYQDVFLNDLFPDRGMISAIEYLGFERNPSMVMAFCVLLQFGLEHNKDWLRGIHVPTTWDRDVHLVLHYNTLYQLNMVEDPTMELKNSGISMRSVWDLLDQAITACGKRLLRERMLNPVVNVEWLEARYRRLRDWLRIPDEKKREIRHNLGVLGDLERFHRRMQLGILNPMECGGIRDMREASRRTLEFLVGYLDVCEWGWTEEMRDKYEKFMEEWETEFVWERLMRCQMDTIQENLFCEGKEPELDKLQSSFQASQQVIIRARDLLLTWARRGDSKADESWFRIDSNERDGYFIAVTAKRWATINKNAPAGHNFKTKTLPSGSGVKVVNPDIEGASDRITALGRELGERCREKYQAKLRDWADRYWDMWSLWAKWESELDLLSAFGEVCRERKYVCPEIRANGEGSWLDARGLRHPLIERIQTQVGYVPNDVMLNGSGLLVFGLNGGGKSSLLKAVGLSVVLAQMGMFVPADSFTYYPFTALHTRILGADNLLKGLSSFMIEMQEMRTILREANPRTLVLGDEICRGTEVASAISIVAASVESLADRRTNFLFATHLHGLASMTELRERDNIEWKHVEVTKLPDGTLDFGRKLRDGVGPSTYGLEVARCIMGDTDMIQRAMRIRSGLKPEIFVEMGTPTIDYELPVDSSPVETVEMPVVEVNVAEVLSSSSSPVTERKNRRSPRLAARRS